MRHENFTNSDLIRLLDLRDKRDRASQYQSFLSDRSIGGLSNFNDPTFIEFTKEDERELGYLEGKLL